MPYYWRLTSGSLPPGLTLQTLNSGREGYLVGNPTQVGVYNWTYTVTDDTPSPDGPLSASNTYTMSVSSSLYLRGTLIDEGGALPASTLNLPLSDPYFNRLYVEELGVHSSTFSVSVVQGTKPSWLTIAAGPTTNITSSTTVFSKYCYAPINFSGTPTAIGTHSFTIRVTSTTGAFIDYTISLVVSQPGVISVSTPTSFVLTANKSYIREGESVVIQLTTTNQANGSTVPYQITGISASDISQSLSGSFTLSNITYRTPIYSSQYEYLEYGDIIGYEERSYQVGYLTITAVSDFTVEGTETMTISLPNQIQQAKADWVTSTSVDILDTSATAARPIYNFFPWQTDMGSPISSATEGQSFYITLETQNVPTGTEFSYTVYGVAAADLGIGSMTGKFRIGSDGKDTKQFMLKPNGIVEAKSFDIFIPDLGLNAYVNIVDVVPTYRVEASATSVAEGDTVIFNFITTSVADGTQFAYYIGGVSSSDINQPTYGLLTVYNNRAGLAVTILEDSSIEGTETLTFDVDIVARTEVQVRDKTVQPSDIDYSLTLGNTSQVLTSGSVITEGDSFYIKIATPGSAVGTNIRYQISGIPQYMIDIPTSGAFTIFPDGYGNGQRIVWASIIPDGGTNNLRTVTVSLPDTTIIGFLAYRTPILSSSFQVKSSPAAISDPDGLLDANTTPANTVIIPSTGPLVITSNPDPLPDGVVGVNYVGGVNYYFSYTGGVGPLTWSVDSGSLPAGLSCSPIAVTASGDSNLFIITGYPTVAGTSTFTIRGTDQNGSSNTITRTITVTDPAVDSFNLYPGGGGYKYKNPGVWEDIYDPYI